MNCTKCRNPLPAEILNTQYMTACPHCRVTIRADVYPAMFREEQAGAAGEAFVFDDEATCFFHPTKKAAVPCSSCGRFLCSLCDVEFNNEHICPACLETGKKKQKIKNLENRRTMYDRMALTLAVLPILFFWPSIITAPIAIFISIRYWNAPSSVVKQTKIRFVLAIIFALLQIIGWIALISNFFMD